MQTIQVGYPMQVVAVDITGLLPESEAGNRYILVVEDYFTKWMEVYAIPDKEARMVAVKLVERSYASQKDFYDKKIHEEPYKKGDLL